MTWYNRLRMALLRVIDPSGAAEMARLLYLLDKARDARLPRIELWLSPDGFAELAGGGMFQPLGMPEADRAEGPALVRRYKLDRERVRGLLAVLYAAIEKDK